jgi:hypothetical protein
MPRRTNQVGLTLHDDELRRMDVVCEGGRVSRSGLLRDLLLAELDRLGIADPGEQTTNQVDAA